MSGLSRTPGKRVWVNSPSGVRIPLSPPRIQANQALGITTPRLLPSDTIEFGGESEPNRNIEATKVKHYGAHSGAVLRWHVIYRSSWCHPSPSHRFMGLEQPGQPSASVMALGRQNPSDEKLQRFPAMHRDAQARIEERKRGGHRCQPWPRPRSCRADSVANIKEL